VFIILHYHARFLVDFKSRKVREPIKLGNKLVKLSEKLVSVGLDSEVDLYIILSDGTALNLNKD
jgi:hypothetical protein